MLFPRKEPADTWSLREGDLPEESLWSSIHYFRDLENNPVFRMILRRRKREFLTIKNPFAWIIAAFLNGFLILRILPFFYPGMRLMPVTVLLLAILMMFVPPLCMEGFDLCKPGQRDLILLIELPCVADIIQSGVSSSTILAGMWGNMGSHRRVQLIRWMFRVALIFYAGVILWLHLRYAWARGYEILILLVGVCVSSAALGNLRFAPYNFLPSWKETLRTERLLLEARLDAAQAAKRSPPWFFKKFVSFVKGVSVFVLIVIPLCVVLWNSGKSLFLMESAVLLLLCYWDGFGNGQKSRDRADAYLGQISSEIKNILDLAQTLLFENPKNWREPGGSR